MTELRQELPPLPERMQRLPVEDRGYPVPWFVAWLDENGDPVPRGEGKPDFRIIHPETIAEAVRFQKCWLCGERLGAYKAYVIGPMCAVNRTSAEPPSHRDCADFAARACPFLARPHARRRDVGKPGQSVEGPGIALQRNPGVALVWVTKKLRRRPDGRGGVLFDVGEPVETRWYAEGRPATRAEVCESIETGLPSLREIAEQDGKLALKALEKARDRAMELVPA